MSTRVILFLGLAAPGAELLSIAVMVTLLGWLVTVGLLVIGALVGMSLLRRSGREALSAWRGGEMRRQRSQGFMLGLSRDVLAGVLLIIPGFFSDLLALAVLLGGKRIKSPWRSAADGQTIDLDPSAYRRLDEDARGPGKPHH